MNKKIFFIISLAVMSTAGMLYKDSCTPDCAGKNAGDMVADPTNCTNYYFCLGDDMPADHPLPCDAGTIFDPDGGKCAAGTDCTPSCQVSVCPITCNGTYSFISDPFDCGTYYICIAGQVQGPIHCEGDTPYFNGENCVKDKEVCCEVSCTPYCGPGIVQAPDPTNCTNYYICTEEGIPNPEYHFHCSSGEVFDFQIGRCSKDATCNTLCPGSTTTTTSVSSTVTPTTTSTTTATTTTTTTPDCINSLVCPGEGYYPQCHQSCQPGYFECTSGGAQGIHHECTGNLVFNTDPLYAYCVLPSNCPYHPPN